MVVRTSYKFIFGVINKVEHEHTVTILQKKFLLNSGKLTNLCLPIKNGIVYTFLYTLSCIHFLIGHEQILSKNCAIKSDLNITGVRKAIEIFSVETLIL